MRLRVSGCVAFGLGVLFTAIPLMAHHSFAAEYDSKQTIKITGAVTKVEWMNPHIYYYVDVKSGDGKLVNYAVEGGTPNQLYRQGWRKNSLRIGDVITVNGYKAKDGSNHLSGRMVTLADGRRVLGGSSEDAGTGAPEN
jgi:hypothetical protein